MSSTPGHTPATRPLVARYAFAVLAALAGLTVSLAFLDVADSPIYAPLIAAVAVTVSFAGLWPALVCAAVGWSLGFWVLVIPHTKLHEAIAGSEVLRWGINLGVALAVVLLTHALRGERERAASAADVAEASVRDLAALQELAAALSAAATTAEVAHSLVTRTPGIIGARGGSVSLVDGDELVIVDPQGGAFETHRPGERLPLTTRAPIARATAGHTVTVRSRAEFERDYPDGAAMTLYAQAALAVPLRIAGRPVGSVSFLFDRAEAMSEDAEAIARIASDLGSQALERADLYEQELSARRALDRILRVAPQLHADTPELVEAAICREARMTFEADVASLWRLEGKNLRLMHAEPSHDALPDGLEIRGEELPQLLQAFEEARISFAPDAQMEALGSGLERLRELGVHSSLRTPIAIANRAELLLVVSWKSIVSAPDAMTVLVARRFADQAALALEQLERRMAEAEAARSADETQRLQEVTARLSLAATSADVTSICLGSALEALGAESGFVALPGLDGAPPTFAASRGLSEAQLELWQGLSADPSLPIARALTSGEPSWLAAAEDVRRARSEHGLEDAGWITLPLVAAGQVRGAIHLILRDPLGPSERTRRWVESVVTQCGQALERSRLLDEEQRQRRRSERLQSMSGRLSNALSLADVAEIALDETGGAVDADGVALAVVTDRQLLRTIAWRGYADEVVESWLEIPVDVRAPSTRALRRRASAYYETLDELRRDFPDGAEASERSGHSSFLFVPLVAGRNAKGVVLLSWAEPHALTADQRRLVEALASQAAQAIDRAEHFEWERTVAETLQRSVLPASLPSVTAVDLAARYLPGTAGLEVGGDWFDAIPLSDDRLGLVVGDVVGKGVAAAANMAQLRNALRAFALDRLKPSSAVARLNRLADESLEAPFATLFYAVVDPHSGICRYTSAGHPPPVAAYPDGRVEFVDGARSLPLGAAADTRYRQEAIELPAGTVLLLYTDGLVERRERPLDVGLELLRTVVRDAPRDPEGMVEYVLDRLVGEGERGDDVAIMAARLLPVAPRPLHLSLRLETESLRVARDFLRAWLEGVPLEESTAHDLVLAAWEACANAVEHGGLGGGTTLVLDGRVTKHALHLRIEDDGRWREPTERPDRGLGLKLMRSLVPSVDVATAGTGTTVILELPLGHSRSEEPDQQQDDQDENQDASTDVHVPPLV